LPDPCYLVIRATVSAKTAQSNVQNGKNCGGGLILQKYKSGSIEAMR